MAQPSHFMRPAPTPIKRRSAMHTRKSNLFKPPQQSPATPDRRRSNTPHYASPTATSKKRARADSRYALIATPVSVLSSTWSIPSVESSMARSSFASPEPFVNTRYNLAGGLDTPSVARESYFDKSEHDDFGVRRRWKSSNVQESEDQQPALDDERNSVRSYSSSSIGQSWGDLVFGVVGKVLQFGSNAFKGFYAGGGDGYQVPQDGRGEDRDERVEGSIWESVDRAPFEREATPVPGSFPEEVEAEFEESSRPAKKRHTENGSPWVMVHNPIKEEPAHTKRTLRASQLRPPISSRRSLIPVSRRSSSNLNADSPAVQPPRPASHAQQRSSSDLSPVPKQSPLSPQAQRYLAEKRREEKQADASIRRLNEQLKAMIKEGKQALGTRVEVLDTESMDLVDDEGYYEEQR